MAQQFVASDRVGHRILSQPGRIGCALARSRSVGGSRRIRVVTDDRAVGIADQQLRVAQHDGLETVLSGADALPGGSYGPADDLLADGVPFGVVAVQ